MFAFLISSVWCQRTTHVHSSSTATTLLPATSDLSTTARTLKRHLLLLVLLLILSLLFLSTEWIAHWVRSLLLHLLNLLNSSMSIAHRGVRNSASRATNRLVIVILRYLLRKLLLYLKQLLNLTCIRRLCWVCGGTRCFALELWIWMHTKRTLGMLLHDNAATSSPVVAAHRLLLRFSMLIWAASKVDLLRIV